MMPDLAAMKSREEGEGVKNKIGELDALVCVKLLLEGIHLPAVPFVSHELHVHKSHDHHRRIFRELSTWRDDAHPDDWACCQKCHRAYHII